MNGPNGLEDMAEVLKGRLKVSSMDQKVVEVNHTLVPGNVNQHPLH